MRPMVALFIGKYNLSIGKWLSNGKFAEAEAAVFVYNIF